MGEDVNQAGSGTPPERIAKRMARAGLCSRRDAERWIADGRVKLDGEVLTSPAVTVTSTSNIEVDGKPLPTMEPARLFRFHKPAGYLTTASDPEGRNTIADLVPKDLPRLMPIGRLDMSSEGLLLLTNDGGLKRQLELPKTGWQRRYRVRVHGDVDENKLASLINGITVEGFDYGPIEASLERVTGKNAWLNVALREGKNREIRRVMEFFGWPVNRLIRVSFGPFHLGNLARADIDEVKTKVVKEQVGLVLKSTTPASQRKRRLKVESNKPVLKLEAGTTKAKQTTVSKSPSRNRRASAVKTEPRQRRAEGGKPQSEGGSRAQQRSGPSRPKGTGSSPRAGNKPKNRRPN